MKESRTEILRGDLEDDRATKGKSTENGDNSISCSTSGKSNLIYDARAMLRSYING